MEEPGPPTTGTSPPTGSPTWFPRSPGPWLLLLVGVLGLVGLVWLVRHRGDWQTLLPRAGAPSTAATGPPAAHPPLRLLALRGLVLDRQGLPVAGAEVLVRPPLPAPPDWLDGTDLAAPPPPAGPATDQPRRGPDAGAPASGPDAGAPAGAPPPDDAAPLPELPGSGGQPGLAAAVAPNQTPPPPLAITRSGPAGGFVLLLPPGRYDLDLGAPRHARHLARQVQPGGPLLVVELEAGYPVLGRLVRFSPGSRIEAEPLAGGDQRPVVLGSPAADGSFRLDGLGLGPYQVTAIDPSGEMATVGPVAAGARDLELALLPRREVTGLVLGQDGRPVAGATVTLAGSGLWPPRTTVTDRAGHYRFAEIPAGWYVLRAVKEPDQASGFLEGVIVHGGTAATEQTLQVEPQPQVEVEVRRADDQAAVAGAELTVAPFLPSVLAVRATTDRSGVARLGPLAPGSYQITVRAANLVTLPEQALTVAVPEQPGARQQVRVTLFPGGTFTGVVLDDQGLPVPAADLEIVSRSEEGEGDSTTSVGPLSRAGDASVRRLLRGRLGGGGLGRSGDPAHRSDGTGQFRLEGVPPGQWTVIARHLGHLAGSAGPFLVAPGQTVRGIELHLPVAAIVRGQVVDGEGDPVAFALVRFEDQSGTATDRHGRFLLPGVRGQGRLLVQAPGFADVSRLFQVDPSDPQRPVLIILDEQSVPLRGFVLGPQGEELAGATVTVQGAGGLQDRLLTTRSGDFFFPSPPPPPWTITVTAPGAARWQRTVARQETPLEVELQAGGTLRLEILEEGTFEPLPRAAIELLGPEKLRFEGKLGNGLLAIDQLLPGSYGVRVQAQGFLPKEREGIPVVDRRDPDPVRLLLTRAGSLGGVVTDLEGAPLSGARVRASQQRGEVEFPALTVRTDVRGAFVLGPLPDGMVRLTVEAAGYQSEVRSERAVAGERFEDLEIKLQPEW